MVELHRLCYQGTKGALGAMHRGGEGMRLAISVIALVLGMTGTSYAASPFDGEYLGEFTLTKIITQCDRPTPGFMRLLTIINGEVKIIYNPRFGTMLNGKIDGAGVFLATGNLPSGFVQMSGRVTGADLAANVETPNCRYTFQAKKRN